FPIPAMLANEDSWLISHVRYMDVSVTHVPVVGLFYRSHANNSYKRGVPFAQVNEQMWVRQRALFYFYEKYRRQLSPEVQQKVLLEVCVQVMRQLGLAMPLMLVHRAALVLRIKMVFDANGCLDGVREGFYKVFSGW